MTGGGSRSNLLRFLAASSSGVTQTNPLLLPVTLAVLGVALVVECVGFGLASSSFWSWSAWDDILTQGAMIGIVAVPVAVLLIGGQLDLSPGAAVALAGTVFALVYQQHGAAYAVLVTLLVCLALAALNGVLVTVLDISSPLVTFATFLLASALSEALSITPVPIFGFDTLGTARPVLHLPLAFLLLLLVALICWAILRFTPFGVAMYAAGLSTPAARLRDQFVRSALLGGFILIGAAVALSGLIQVSYLASSPTSFSVETVLWILCAVVLGGTGVTGGRGTILGVVIAAIGIGVFLVGFALTSSNFSLELLLLAIALVAGVAVSRLVDWVSGIEEMRRS